MKRSMLTLIILVLAGSAIYGGWRLWHKPAAKNEATSTNSAQTKTADQYLVVKQWGVKFKLSGDINDATYTPKDSLTIYVSAAKLRAVRGCENANILEIQRGKANDFIGPSKVSEIIANNPNSLTKLGDYYYALVAAPNSCAATDDSQGRAMLNQIRDNFTQAIKTVERSD